MPKFVSQPLSERFFERVSIGGLNACWEWRCVPTRLGYAQLTINGRKRQAHRYVYEWLTGKTIGAGLHLHHTCKNRLCVNPRHLTIETPLSHAAADDFAGARATQEKWKAVTHCKRGHEFTEENTYWKDGGKHRECRTCKRARWEAWRDRR